MDPETVMRVTYDNVITFLQRMLGTNKMTIIAQHLNKTFPTWEHFWSAIRNWLLKEHPLTNMQHSIHSFAQLFPNYESFADDLDQSLALHDEFWNKVYIQLCAAQKGLKC